jgi:hypothetical protein
VSIVIMYSVAGKFAELWVFGFNYCESFEVKMCLCLFMCLVMLSCTLCGSIVLYREAPEEPGVFASLGGW